MAIGPKEAEQRYLKENAERIETLEKKIDEHLTTYYKEGNAYISARSCTPPVIKELRNRYKEAGWYNLEYESNRDGSQIILIRDKPYNSPDMRGI